MEVSRTKLQALAMLLDEILEEKPVKKQAIEQWCSLKIEPATEAENQRARELMNRIP